MFSASKQITNPRQEAQIFNYRLRFVIGFLAVAFLTILGRVGYLQIVTHQEQLARSDSYHLRYRAIAPERGLIYDASGRVLAGNRHSYALYVHPLKLDSTKASDLIADLGQLINLEDTNLNDFYNDISQTRGRNQLVLLRDRLTEQEISRLMVHRYRLPSIEIQPKFQRFYPQGDSYSHVLGYIGRISEDDLARIKKEEYRGLDRIGKVGLEQFYEEILRGEAGVEEIGVNAHGQVVDVYAEEPATKGKDIVLWLDHKLQNFVWESLGEEKGAVVILDANTGGILSMVSKPSYDNNQFVHGISDENFAKLREDEDSPLLNRASSGRYPPGSTIKPFYSIMALSKQVVDPRFTINDPGWFRLPNSDIVFRNWKRSGHGKVNLQRAIRVSSDTYFYTLANMMGIETMTDGLSKFGFGSKSSYDLYSEFADPLPNENWKIERHNLPWFPGDTVNMGIGQGYLLASPMQLAAATLILVNRGHGIKPRLVKTIDGSEILSQDTPHLINASADHWDLVFQGMVDVVHHKEGTAKAAGRDALYNIAGKTGTSQVVSLELIEERERQGLAIKKEWRDHASYVGFFPAEEPEYVIAVVLENGGSGSNAAIMARRISDYLMFTNNYITDPSAAVDPTNPNLVAPIN